MNWLLILRWAIFGLCAAIQGTVVIWKIIYLAYKESATLLACSTRDV